LSEKNYSLSSFSITYYTPISKTVRSIKVSISGIIMGIITVLPIGTREWETLKDRKELVKERDRERKKSQQSVDERIHYMWFKYLQLCLDLESIDYSIPKRGGRGKTISSTKVKVSKDKYRDWDLEKVKKSSFREWCDEDKQLLFYEGGFKYSKGTQYHPLVKRFNVFILYTNMMNGDFVDDTGGTMEKGMRVSELIMEDLQITKVRYELLDRDTGYDDRGTTPQKRVLSDVVDCENSILAVCEGRFPK